MTVPFACVLVLGCWLGVRQTRNPGDTSYLQLGFWNLTYRGDLGRVDFSKTDYTQVTASVSVPSQIVEGGYGELHAGFVSPVACSSS